MVRGYGWLKEPPVVTNGLGEASAGGAGAPAWLVATAPRTSTRAMAARRRRPEGAAVGWVRRSGGNMFGECLSGGTRAVGRHGSHSPWHWEWFFRVRTD